MIVAPMVAPTVHAYQSHGPVDQTSFSGLSSIPPIPHVQSSPVLLGLIYFGRCITGTLEERHLSLELLMAQVSGPFLLTSTCLYVTGLHFFGIEPAQHSRSKINR